MIPAGVYGGAEAALRNMGDPRTDGDPDHYSERSTSTSDNGGVHTNSGIPNHVHYLAVVGGRNAGCDVGGSGGHTLAADCATTVNAIGLARAEQIFYQAFISLIEYANFCDARNAAVAVAKGARRSISNAWAAVDVHQGCEPALPPLPCVSDDTAELPFGTPHPYDNNGDCTWTFDNGSAGSAFHLILLKTAAGYDYVKDAKGNVLATYDGTHPLPGGVTTPWIPTSVGSLQFVTDQAAVDQGFTVDAVEVC